MKITIFQGLFINEYAVTWLNGLNDQLRARISKAGPHLRCSRNFIIQREKSVDVSAANIDNRFIFEIVPPST